MCFAVVFVGGLRFVAQGALPSSLTPRVELLKPSTIIQGLHDSNFPILSILKTC